MATEIQISRQNEIMPASTTPFWNLEPNDPVASEPTKAPPAGYFKRRDRINHFLRSVNIIFRISGRPWACLATLSLDYDALLVGDVFGVTNPASSLLDFLYSS